MCDLKCMHDNDQQRQKKRSHDPPAMRAIFSAEFEIKDIRFIPIVLAHTQTTNRFLFLRRRRPRAHTNKHTYHSSERASERARILWVTHFFPDRLVRPLPASLLLLLLLWRFCLILIVHMLMNSFYSLHLYRYSLHFRAFFTRTHTHTSYTKK